MDKRLPAVALCCPTEARRRAPEQDTPILRHNWLGHKELWRTSLLSAGFELIRWLEREGTPPSLPFRF
jgi:hypothetical protein